MHHRFKRAEGILQSVVEAGGSERAAACKHRRMLMLLPTKTSPRGWQWQVQPTCRVGQSDSAYGTNANIIVSRLHVFAYIKLGKIIYTSAYASSSSFASSSVRSVSQSSSTKGRLDRVSVSKTSDAAVSLEGALPMPFSTTNSVSAMRLLGGVLQDDFLIRRRVPSRICLSLAASILRKASVTVPTMNGGTVRDG